MRSPAMKKADAVLRAVAGKDVTLTLIGESGTGKELAVAALHDASPRSKGPLVAVNCGAIPETLIESELFGHAKGAFTGAHAARPGWVARAEGGTLFLDEVGKLSLPMQVKILRLLQQKEYSPVGEARAIRCDLRVVAATNRDLHAEVAAGRFRRDLFYRLEVLTLSIPPLRQRPEDVAELVQHFNAQLSSRLGLPPLTVTPADLVRLATYPWPGNVRELRNLIERSLILGSLPVHNQVQGMADPLPLSLAEVEKRHILAVLDQCGGNKTHAATLLGVSRKTLDRKAVEWGLA